ncbi:MAG: DUF167 domain-containing protein [Bdellovibrionales bacterium]
MTSAAPANPDERNRLVAKTANGVVLLVRAKPGISKSRKPKIVEIGDGQSAVEIAINAPAQDGKANKALLAALAEQLDIPQNALSIVSGETNRLKRILIKGDPATQHLAITQWLEKCE